MINSYRYQASWRTERIIGREDILQEIRAAIFERNLSEAFYIYGKAGFGKTRLLQEIGRIIGDETSYKPAWSGIVDLYHSDTQNPMDVEHSIVEALDPEGREFSRYRQIYNQYQGARRQLGGASSVEMLRSRLSGAFRSDYAAFVGQQRAVLTFDTLELLRYERDRAQDVCRIDDTNTSVKQWLLSQTSQLPNTVVIFAGRPDEEMARELSEHFYHFQKSKLLPFSLPETRAYVDELKHRDPSLADRLPSDVVEEIHQLTGGRPIYVGLAVNLLVDSDVEVSRLFPVSHSSEHGDEMPELLGKAIVEALLDLPEPQRSVIHFLTFTHQGLDADLLAELTADEGWDRPQVLNALQATKRYSFVKSRPEKENGNRDILFFHDEFYDLFDNFYWPVNRQEEALKVFEPIRDYYAQRYQEVREALGPPAEEGTVERDGKTQRELVSELEECTIKLLHYELQCDPRHAYYHRYTEWETEAINSFRLGYDMRLRSTILRFLGRYTDPGAILDTPRTEWLKRRVDRLDIDRDCVLRWLRRLLVQGDYKGALERARYMRQLSDDEFEFNPDDDPLYCAGLLTELARAMRLRNYPLEQTAAQLLEAIELLSNLPPASDDLRNAAKRRARLLGRAAFELGYVYQVNFRLEMAAHYFQEALRFYRMVDVLDEMANTLNSLAYTYSLLGATDESLDLIRDALNLRERLGARFPLGLSWNTMANIYLQQDKPEHARACCQKAMEHFHDRESGDVYKYGVRLANEAMGNILRALMLQVYDRVRDREDAFTLAAEAEKLLSDVIEEYADGANRRARMSVMAELGRLYRDWMGLLRHFGESAAEVRQKQALARYYLGEARKIAQELDLKDMEADLLEDVAVIEFKSGKPDEALKRLQEAEQCIPDEYKIGGGPGKGFQKIAEPNNFFWLLMGKIHLLRSEILFEPYSQLTERLTEEQKKGILDSIRENLLAAAYVEHYSPSPAGLQRMRGIRSDMYKKLKRYGEPFQAEVKQMARKLYDEKEVDFRSILEYMEFTLGSFGFPPEAVDVEKPLEIRLYARSS